MGFIRSGFLKSPDFFGGILMDYLLAGISVGGQYALIAIGYTMAYCALLILPTAIYLWLRDL